ncbi:hypothetical protein ACIRTB_24530 [Streptomyces sp. NPDC101158]|uniref:SCO2400 family protein n=1 Tax=Streptomyces sp. NPDC101158 TaxID=3366117 RepID=UPI0037F276AD
MDYCPQCRRHLNGALACAGCGTPAEELRYFTPHPPAPAPAPAFTQPAETPPPVEEEYGHAYELDPVEPPRPAEGRAAARRGRSRSGGGRAAPRGGRRARSRRGRTVLLGTLGFALAAGSLSMAKLALDQPAGGAATAVQEEDVVEATLDPDPPAPSESTGRPDGPGPVESVTARPTSTGHPTRGSGRGGGTGGASGDGTGTGPGDGSGSGDGTGTGTGSGDGSGASPRASVPGPENPSGTPSTGPSGSASPAPGGGPTTAPGTPTASPSPSPSPTPTCTRFLWWCV